MPPLSRTFATLLATTLLLPTASAMAQTAPAEPTAFVHLDASRTVTLVSRNESDRRWVRVCDSPCDRYLPLHAEYRIHGGWTRTSGPFVLQAKDGGNVDLHVGAGSRVAQVGGISLVVVGVGAVALGILGMVGPFVAVAGGGPDRDLFLGSAVVAAAGVGGIAGGALLFAGSKTRVEAYGATAPAMELPQAATELRAPTWASNAIAVAAPETTGLPVLSVSF